MNPMQERLEAYETGNKSFLDRIQTLKTLHQWLTANRSIINELEDEFKKNEDSSELRLRIRERISKIQIKVDKVAQLVDKIEQQQPIPNKTAPKFIAIKKPEPRKPINLMETVMAIEAVKNDAAVEEMQAARAKAEFDAIEEEKLKKAAESLRAVKAIHDAIEDEAQEVIAFDFDQPVQFKIPEHIRIKNYVKRTTYIGLLFLIGGLMGIMISLFTM